MPRTEPRPRPQAGQQPLLGEVGLFNLTENRQVQPHAEHKGYMTLTLGDFAGMLRNRPVHPLMVTDNFDVASTWTYHADKGFLPGLTIPRVILRFRWRGRPPYGARAQVQSGGMGWSDPFAFYPDATDLTKIDVYRVYLPAPLVQAMHLPVETPQRHGWVGVRYATAAECCKAGGPTMPKEAAGILRQAGWGTFHGDLSLVEADPEPPQRDDYYTHEKFMPASRKPVARKTPKTRETRSPSRLPQGYRGAKAPSRASTIGRKQAPGKVTIGSFDSGDKAIRHAYIYHGDEAIGSIEVFNQGEKHGSSRAWTYEFGHVTVSLYDPYDKEKVFDPPKHRSDVAGQRYRQAMKEARAWIAKEVTGSSPD